jgi:hypothetical protein
MKNEGTGKFSKKNGTGYYNSTIHQSADGHELSENGLLSSKYIFIIQRTDPDRLSELAIRQVS